MYEMPKSSYKVSVEVPIFQKQQYRSINAVKKQWKKKIRLYISKVQVMLNNEAISSGVKKSKIYQLALLVLF